MEPAEFLAHLESDGAALAAAARRAPAAAIPSCPEWDMTELLLHVGAVHHWVAEIVRTGATEYVKRQSPTAPSEPESALTWFEEGVVGVLDALGASAVDLQVWNWFDRRPAPVSFWHRRMAHETAVHRWDGEAGAGGEPGPIPADLAVDGIDEFLRFVSVWLARKPVAGLAGSLHLHATDFPGEWSMTLAPDHLEYQREHRKADAAIRGSASDLLLWTLNRKPVDCGDFEVFGHRAIVEGWRQINF